MTRTQSWQPPVRAELRGLTPYGAPQLDVPVRLNTNENPYRPPAAMVAELTEAVRDAAATMHRYPDRDARALRGALAGYLGHGLVADSVWAANGSNEIMQQVLQVFGGSGRAALGFSPSYSMHRLIALGTGTQWIDGRRAEDFTVEVDRAVGLIRARQPDVVFLTSPNNPTGTALPLETVSAVLRAAPGIVVVDEAYAEFARPGTPSALALLPGNPGLVVTRTMSKAFAMAGARIGYLAADPAVVDSVQLVRLPYHLSTLTQLAGLVALRHAPEMLATVGEIRRARDHMVSWLRARGLTAVDSDANFVLFGRFPDSGAVWRELLGRGVLVRDPGLPGWLRVTIGLSAEMAEFRAALDAVRPRAGQEVAG